jgi:hypothetical protein
VDAFYGNIHWAGRPGSFSGACSRMRSESWSVYESADSYRILRPRHSRGSRSGREPVLGFVGSAQRSYTSGRSRSHSGRANA